MRILLGAIRSAPCVGVGLGSAAGSGLPSRDDDQSAGKVRRHPHMLSLKPTLSVFQEEGGQAQKSPGGTVCDLLAGSLECLAQASKSHTDFNYPQGQVSSFGKL